MHDEDDDDDSPRDEDRPRRRRDREDDGYEPRAPQKNGYALWALLCGIGSFFCSLLLGIPAIILGILGISRASKTGTGMGMSIAGIILGVISIPLVFVMIGLLLPAVQKVREAAGNQKNMNNAKQVNLALQDYEIQNAQFPAARHAQTSTSTGRNLSWRVTILPQLGEGALFQSFKPNEDWNSPANAGPSATSVAAYADPLDPPGTTETRFQAFTGPGTAFYFSNGSPVRRTSITDGTSNTLLFVEATKSVPWASAQDILYTGPSMTTFPVGRPNAKRFLAAYADGSVRMLSTNINPATMHSLIQIADGKVVGPDGFGD